MGLFDIFKKTQAISSNNIFDQLASDKIKVPKEKLHKIKITHEEFMEYSNDRHENFKITEKLSKTDYPPLGGRIVGYYPNPKDIITRLMAVVEYPIIGETQKTFVVNCSPLGKNPTTGTLTYPAEGSWIMFQEIGEDKDHDGKTRSYGIASIVLTESFIKMIEKLAKSKK
ncbi:MAG: hypothetical protein EVA56_03705 [alpha proteobacterium HIMB114]|nr:MAG: hypothetical protein EVA56_03705 [alpha proteobacterium HIMB114]|tara:strand:- start:736 stop:1245 length:510 start_codon:yes stop_codon:yes gene_type:complete